MGRFIDLIFFFKGKKVYALVGRSGTGKSFRAKLIASKYNIELIIDDGLLIKDNKIIAGKSAKKEDIYLKAIKTAVFDDVSHRNEVIKTLETTKFKKILLIGTSEKMVRRICERLKLPEPHKIIQIEDISSQDEIERAIKSRTNEGKHVIPVPSVEIHKNYPSILADSIRILIQNRFKGISKNGKKVYEKSVVRPEFSRKGTVSISEAGLAQMVYHCADEFDRNINIKKLYIKDKGVGYILKLQVVVPFGTQLSGNMHDFQNYLISSIEKYTGIMIVRVDLEIDELSSK